MNTFKSETHEDEPQHPISDGPMHGHTEHWHQPEDNPWLPEPPGYYRTAKRAIDIGFSLVFLAVLAPAFLGIFIAIKLTSKGPAMFRQQRLGRHGKPFTMLKFRTMSIKTGQKAHHDYVTRLISGEYGAVGERVVFKLRRDPRLTAVGRFLRRTSLDELPQIWNVLKGDMSLVGPRPAMSYEWEMYQPWHRLRLSATPGITGLWQILGRSRTTFDEMVQMDIEYSAHPSLLLDLKVLVKTPLAVLRSDSAF